MILARVKKIKSRFGQEHSTFGESKEYHIGQFDTNPKQGERFKLYGDSLLRQGIDTSPVTKILPHGRFWTMNSLYQLDFEPQEYHYSCFKYYDTLGRRVAVFGIQQGDNIKYIGFPCNLKDQFCIRTARNLFFKYAQGGAGKDVIAITRPGSSQEDFIRYCRSNLLQKVEMGFSGIFQKVEHGKFDRVSKTNHIYVTYLKPHSSGNIPLELNRA